MILQEIQQHTTSVLTGQTPSCRGHYDAQIGLVADRNGTNAVFSDLRFVCNEHYAYGHPFSYI